MWILLSLVVVVLMLYVLVYPRESARDQKFKEAREAKKIRLLIEKDKKRGARSHPRD